MKKTLLILTAVFALAACNSPKTDSNNDQRGDEESTQTTAVGGEKDEHGCLTAAGETWSQIKRSCVQIFNVGQRLNPIENKDGEAIISAFVLFSDDKSEVELFLPDVKSNSVLQSTGDNIYENGRYKYNAEHSSLYIDGDLAYRAENMD